MESFIILNNRLSSIYSLYQNRDDDYIKAYVMLPIVSTMHGFDLLNSTLDHLRDLSDNDIFDNILNEKLEKLLDSITRRSDKFLVSLKKRQEKMNEIEIVKYSHINEMMDELLKTVIYVNNELKTLFNCN